MDEQRATGEGAEPLLVAVTGGPPLVRHGVAVQLRALGVEVVAESAPPPPLPPHVALVLIADGAIESLLDDITTYLRAGADLVVLVPDDADAPVPAATLVAHGHPVRRGRLHVIALDEDCDAAAVVAALRPGNVVVPRMTRTERAVHALLARGLSNAGIARELSLSPKTVEGAVSAVFDKLGLARDDSARNRRVEAAMRWAPAPLRPTESRVRRVV
ncbi:helix-turn-helix transcriptional regulator [Cellulomonas composti]|uniref:HTH luxR-type domain-containing protein n=1 Tax=Cellulomonas composti TaxID=266130 RepID=A0A511JDF9_9CELL|nr:LuxR C-terminal-related transcriptional regulator [Cellulomonas composti]GEL96014.1 hypothetical protein CCO02nite_26720 [Cellulomonas composti]